MSAIRPAAVAGTFYPASAAALSALVEDGLDAAAPGSPGERPKLIVVPHAGYVYSGAVAASAYARLRPWAAQIRRVVLLGPVHRVAVRALAAPTVDAFDTPLGRVPIDQAALATLADLPQVVRSDLPHAPEHSLEVQLPFLQQVLGEGWQLVPLVVGDAMPEEVAQVIERLWGGDETLIVISTDLSHYLPYAQAQARDARTVQRIGERATDLDPHDACGARALNGALLAARHHGLAAELLDLRNSGDTAGDRRRVVGYAALAFAPATPDEAPAAEPAQTDLAAALLSRARNAVRVKLGLPPEIEPPHPALSQPGATFVTLHDAHGALRGCIGSLSAWRSLDEDVRHNAEAAAFRDSRFRPLTRAEWEAGLQVEVSLLEAPQPLPPFRTQAQALALLNPGLDGLIFEWRGHRATFLPQVWAELPEPAAFLAALKRKAGLAADFWADDVRLSRYRVRSFE